MLIYIRIRARGTGSQEIDEFLTVSTRSDHGSKQNGSSPEGAYFDVVSGYMCSDEIEETFGLVVDCGTRDIGLPAQVCAVLVHYDGGERVDTLGLAKVKVFSGRPVVAVALLLDPLDLVCDLAVRVGLPGSSLPHWSHVDAVRTGFCKILSNGVWGGCC